MSDLELKNVYFSYDNQKNIINNVNLFAPQGSRIAIVGKNGAGKSTLAKLINGLLKPINGDIYVHNLNTKSINTSKIANYVGYIFQNPDDQIFNSTVKKEIQFGIKNPDESYYKEILELTGLLDKEDENPFDLSISERKFINIASTLLRKPEVIIMDEITGGQDIKGKKRIKNILNWLRNKKMTVLFITHDINYLCENFDDIVIMSKGNIIYNGSVSQAFCNEEILKSANINKPIIMNIMESINVQNVLTKDEAINILCDILSNKNSLNNLM